MANMNDVAKLAGVSRGTVSNYINGGNVKQSSKNSIKKAIEKLHYVPNNNARELKMNRSNFVVFIIPTTQTPFFAELTKEIQTYLKENKFKMLLCLSNNDIKDELEYLQMAKEQKVAGIITISYSNLDNYLNADFPIVSIEKKFKKNITCISSEQYEGGKLAAEQLHIRGLKSMLLITRSTEQTKYNYGIRAQGFIDYCNDHHLSYTVFNPEVHDDEFYDLLEVYIKKQYKSNITFEGIFSTSDQYADYCFRLLLALGYKIPDDIQIIGFDGGKMYAEQDYYLSSIRQPVKKIANECVKQLIFKIKHQDERVREEIIIPTSFVNGITTK